MGEKKGRLKKWIKILAIILIPLIVAGVLVVGYLPTIFFSGKKASPPDLSLLNINEWDKTVYNLVPPPSEDGNAMEYFLEAIHFGFLYPMGDMKSKITYSWWDKLSKSDVKSKDPAIVALVSEAIKIPELDILVKASKQKNYQWVGIYAVPSAQPDASYYLMKTPNHLDLLRLANLLLERAKDKLAKNDIAGAETDLIAGMRIGHILQKDVDMIMFIIGSSFELKFTNEIMNFYHTIGEEEKAKKWEELQAITKKRHEVIGSFTKYMMNN